jgi:hypothetical protein
MPNFQVWFNKEYQRWNKSQPGAEDFLAFCSLLGYPQAMVLSWLKGDSAPQGPEILSVAGVLGMKAYDTLGQPEPDPELLTIYNSFSHLTGDYRSKLSFALWEVSVELQQKQITAKSEEAKAILAKAFQKWGIGESEKN